MNKINDGGPAFPRPMSEIAGVCLAGQDGMSLRDYFAAKALVGVLAQHYGGDDEVGPNWSAQGQEPEIAATAYSLADAMLAERDK